MWDIIGELLSGGTTLLLTTQYLDEADRLADCIAVVIAERVIAEGTSSGLKPRGGGEYSKVTITEGGDLDAAIWVLERCAKGGDSGVHPDTDRWHVGATVQGGAGLVAAVVRDLDAAGVEVEDLGLRPPTLNDVLLSLTGRTVEETDDVGRGERRDEKGIA
jgi:ABC-2 type transport system ATP-binding protein